MALICENKQKPSHWTVLNITAVKNPKSNLTVSWELLYFYMYCIKSLADGLQPCLPAFSFSEHHKHYPTAAFNTALLIIHRHAPLLSPQRYTHPQFTLGAGLLPLWCIVNAIYECTVTAVLVWSWQSRVICRVHTSLLSFFKLFLLLFFAIVLRFVSVWSLIIYDRLLMSLFLCQFWLFRIPEAAGQVQKVKGRV